MNSMTVEERYWPDKTRKELIEISNEEIMCWVHDVPLGSSVFPGYSSNTKWFVNRWNRAYFSDVALIRQGIQLTEPVASGELTVSYE
jgi:hypothetical protein